MIKTFAFLVFLFAATSVEGIDSRALAGREVYVTPGVRYVLMDTTDPSYAGIITAARARHQIERPGNKMSILLSIDGTLALVKMIDINDAFETAHFGRPAVLQVFTRETHDQAIDVISGPDWMTELP